MTVQLDWPPEFLPASQSDNLAEADERKKTRSRILEIQTRVAPDPEGWTSRDYISQGRR